MAETDILTEADARHLLRRATFGPVRRDLQTLTGRSRGEAADRLLAYKPSGFTPKGDEHADIHAKWFKYMLGAPSGLQEKLTLFWHDHFATGIAKVRDAKFMGVQNALFRTMGKGSFRDLVNAVHRDPAMVDWLDTDTSRKQQPNENYARELMELFTLGVFDFAGKANYDEQDVSQIARAFTGWNRVVYFQGDRMLRGGTLFTSGLHDYYYAADGSVEDAYGRGPKIIFATPVDQPSPPGNLSPAERDYAPNRGAEGDAEIDAVTDRLLLHRDSLGYSTVGRRIAKRLIEFFAHTGPSVAFVDDVVAASGFASSGSWRIQDLLKQIFVHDDFYPRTNPTKPKSVKWPIDMLVQTLTVLKAKTRRKEQYVGFPHGDPALDVLTNMGQVLFDPPSVFGWDGETTWVSTTGVLARATMTRGLLYDPSGIRPERVMDMTITDPAEIVDAVADVFAVREDLTAAARATLVDFMSVGGTVSSVDLKDQFTGYVRLRELFSLIMQSPAYQVH